MRALLVRALTIFLAPAACGSAAPTLPDASIDAGAMLCDLPPGFTHFVTQIRYPSADQGLDLDGDGTVDNMIGNLPQAYRDQIHQGLDTSIEAGETEMVLHVTGWSEPPTPDDPDVTIHPLVAVDEEIPPDPDDNFDGEGRFVIRLSEFDLQCGLRNGSDTGSVADRVLTAHRASWDFPLSIGTGSLKFVDATFAMSFSEDYRTSDGRLGGIIPACSLAALPFPGDLEGSTLDLFVNDPEVTAAVQIDRDLDGDGLEQVIGDGVQVARCIDGDGTIVEGRDCPCHPKIVDGYSMAMDTQGVLAQLVGVILQ